MKKNTYFIHVNKHNITHNLKNPDDMRPVIAVKKGNKNIGYGNHVKIEGDAEVIYNPEKPILSCGARCVIKTKGKVTIMEDENVRGE